MALEELVARKAALSEASAAIGREAPPDTRMSYRVDFSRATPAQVVSDLSRYREAPGLEAFQINFHGNRDLRAVHGRGKAAVCLRMSQSCWLNGGTGKRWLRLALTCSCNPRMKIQI